MRLFKIQKTALLKLNYKQLIFNIMKTTILSLVLLLLASCQDNKKEQLLHLVKEWQGKEIRFPEKPVFTRFVTDTTDYRIPAAADYKVVVYVDSIGCVSVNCNYGNGKSLSPKWILPRMGMSPSCSFSNRKTMMNYAIS